MSAGCRRITDPYAAALQHVQDRTCISGRRRHAHTILVLSTHPYRLTPRARKNLIWPLNACRSSRMEKLDFIAPVMLASPRDVNILLPDARISRGSVATPALIGELLMRNSISYKNLTNCRPLVALLCLLANLRTRRHS